MCTYTWRTIRALQYSIAVSASFQSPTRSCHFPSWLQSSKWIDFAVESVYSFSERQLVINRYKGLEDTGRSIYRFQCWDTDRASNSSVILMHVQTVHKW